jgi:ABC-2 type transport system permease protein
MSDLLPPPRDRRGGRIATIAWREFRQTVFRKVFLLGVIGMPVLFVAIGAVAAVMIVRQRQPPLVGTVAIVDADGALAAAVEHEFTREQLEHDREERLREMAEAPLEMDGPPLDGGAGAAALVMARGEVRVAIERVADESETSIAALRTRVESSGLLAAAIVGRELLTPPKAADVGAGAGADGDGDGDTDGDADTAALAGYRLLVAPELDADHARLIERRIGEAIVAVRAARAGIDPDLARLILDRPDADTRRLRPGGQEESEHLSRAFKELLPVIFMILMWVATFVAGQHLMMSTIEEKSNRVMEVLLSAVSPFQLMAGKILGHGAVGLLIIVLYSGLGLAALVALALLHLVEPMGLVHLGLYFVMAYFMLASLMAAVGSAVSDVREANVLITPVMLILMIPWMLWMPISQAPNGAVAQVCSFLPPAIPFAMVIRLSADEPVPAWQVPATLAWGYLCTLVMVWGAAKIFRVGVLMYGKPPTPIELLRWVRYR